MEVSSTKSMQDILNSLDMNIRYWPLLVILHHFGTVMDTFGPLKPFSSKGSQTTSTPKISAKIFDHPLILKLSPLSSQGTSV